MRTSPERVGGTSPRQATDQSPSGDDKRQQDDRKVNNFLRDNGFPIGELGLSVATRDPKSGTTLTVHPILMANTNLQGDEKIEMIRLLIGKGSVLSSRHADFLVNLAHQKGDHALIALILPMTSKAQQ